MKLNKTIYSLILLITIFTISCKKMEIKDINTRQCSLITNQSHPKASNYQKIIDSYNDAGTVGTSITIISPEGTWSKSNGMADLKNQIELTSCDLMRIASISKVYTATAIMMLIEDGKINLDAKISDYISEDIINNITNGNKITVKQLLNHTSGIKNYVYVTANSWTNNSIKGLSAEENLKYIYNKPADFEPGTKFAYSNSGYLLLGIIIKNVTNKNSAYEAITDMIIVPNNYTNTVLTNEPILNSNGYRDLYDKGVMKDFSYVDENAVSGQDMTDGGIISNSYDVATFFHSLMNNEIISTNTMELMQTWYDPGYPSTEGYASYEGYGLGLTKIKVKDKIAIGHFGMVNCFNTLVYHFPEDNITICVLNNSYSNTTEKVHLGDEFYKYLFQ